MKKHYDIAVVGVWFGANYGSLINGYAIYKLLKNMGLSVLMVEKPNAEINDWEILNPHCRKFIEKFYLFEEIGDLIPYDRLPELNKYCDIFLAGSDQIWHYNLSKAFEFAFMLNFVDDNKKKISFGTSFGHQQDFTPEEIRPKVKQLLRRFNAISVREQSGVDICRDIYGVKAEKTIEPVFCLDIKDYQEIASKSEMNEKEPYIFTYILDPTPAKLETIEYYRQISGMKVICILDGDPFRYKEAIEMFNISDILPNETGAEDLIKLCMHASFVITDSFHGSCFAIIFNKPFLSIINTKRGNVRFYELAKKFGLEDKFAIESDNIPQSKKMLESIDYTQINDIILKEKQKAVTWLKRAIEMPSEKLPNIVLQDTITEITKKEKCTGCGACVSICPANALSLQANELGYYCPMVDYTKCISCGKCIEICPAIKLPKNQNSDKPKLFEIIVANEKILYNSSSGGAFPTLARKVFEMHGVVVGAAWRNDFSVEHIIINDEKELYKLQKSKYLQSYLGDIFRKIKEKLEGGIFVLFSGCPCQAAGLKSYLQKEYDNLIIVDLLCSNTPSAMFFQKYLADDFTEPLKKYEFRHKRQGGKAECDCISVTTITGVTEVRRGGKQDNYQRVYHNHVMCAPHCEKCNYQTVPRFGDLTIGDFWGISGKDKTIDTSKGVSAVLCNNEKGRKFLDSIPQEVYSIKKQVPLEWLGGNGYAINGSHNYCSPKRNDFYKAIKTMSFNEAIVYALKPNHGVKSERGLFDFSAKENHFTFNPSIWNEDYINGTIVLTTRESYPRVGNYAVMPVHSAIKAGKAYILKIRFKLSTNAPIYNFHLKSAGESLIQVIYSHKVELTDSTKWVEVSHEFVADSNVYDEFMIGASQLSGENRWLVIDYIKIFEKI